MKNKDNVEDFVRKSIMLEKFMKENDIDILNLALFINEKEVIDFVSKSIMKSPSFNFNDDKLEIDLEPDKETKIKIISDIYNIGNKLYKSNLKNVKEMVENKEILADYNIIELDNSSNKILTKLFMSQALVEFFIDENKENE